MWRLWAGQFPKQRLQTQTQPLLLWPVPAGGTQPWDAAGSGASQRSCGDSECRAEEDTLTGRLETCAVQSVMRENCPAFFRTPQCVLLLASREGLPSRSLLPCPHCPAGGWEEPPHSPPAQERGRLRRARPTAASLSAGARQQKREGALQSLLPAGAQRPRGLLHQRLRGDQRGEVSVGGG